MALFAIIAAIAAVATAVVSFVLRPKKKRQQPNEFNDLESPTSGEGRHIMVVMGTAKIKSPNVMAYMDKNSFVHKINKST